MLLLFVLGANFCPQPTTSNQTTDLFTANLTAIFDATSNEYKTRVHVFHSLSSFLPLPTSLALLPRTPTPGTHHARATSQPREHIACYLVHNGRPRRTCTASLDPSVPRMRRLPTSESRTNLRWRSRRRGLIDHLNELPRRGY